MYDDICFIGIFVLYMYDDICFRSTTFVLIFICLFVFIYFYYIFYVHLCLSLFRSYNFRT